jgi:hypothetical protein
MLKVGQSGVCAIEIWLDRLRRGARLRGARWLRVVAFAVDKGVPASPPSDLAQTHQITSSEAIVAVLELPQRTIGVPGMKYISFLVESIHVQLPHERRYIGVFEILPVSI